jgi:hypothetical protein
MPGGVPILAAIFGNGHALIETGSNPRVLRLDKPFRAGAFLPESGTFRANNAGGRAILEALEAMTKSPSRSLCDALCPSTIPRDACG